MSHKSIIKIIMLGDIIGNSGIEQVYVKLPEIKKREKIDLVVANGENSDNGFGITEDNIKIYKQCGIDVITSGNHIWSNFEINGLLQNYSYLLRPANYPEAEGRGYYIVDVDNTKIGVVNLIGRYYMTPVDCPFHTLNKLLRAELKGCDFVVVDFHAEFASEKFTLANDFDGKVTVVCGTHTHVQTADENILPNGTGYITDLGMCGVIDGIIGMDKDIILNKMLYRSFSTFVPAKESKTKSGRMQGVLVSLDKETKKLIEIKRFSI